MKRNFHYVLSATFVNSNKQAGNYVHYFPTLIRNYNNHIVTHNPKEIDSICLSISNTNIIIFDFWSEKQLPRGRELQSLRRVSEDLACYDKSLVIGKSHVLISDWFPTHARSLHCSPGRLLAYLILLFTNESV